MTPSDVQVLFLERLGIQLGDDMTDYLVRRFSEGGAAAAPMSHLAADADPIESVRRFVELTGALGAGSVLPADAGEPDVH